MKGSYSYDKIPDTTPPQNKNLKGEKKHRRTDMFWPTTAWSIMAETLTCVARKSRWRRERDRRKVGGGGSQRQDNYGNLRPMTYILELVHTS